MPFVAVVRCFYFHFFPPKFSMKLQQNEWRRHKDLMINLQFVFYFIPKLAELIIKHTFSQRNSSRFLITFISTSLEKQFHLQGSRLTCQLAERIDSTRNVRDIVETFLKCLVDFEVVVKSSNPFSMWTFSGRENFPKKRSRRNIVLSRKVQMSTKLAARDEVGT